MNVDHKVEALEFTGERMVPEGADETTFWEHIYRYRFALSYVRDRRVLDIACGEGYGSAALLRGGAQSVLGVDVSPEACDHAHKRYGIETRQGDAAKIPLADASVDVVISFETIEHVPNPAAFLDECRRVLRPGGTIVISTPNRDIYREISPENEFHCSELSVDEFINLFEARFRNPKFYWQRPRKVGLFDLRGLIADRWPLKKIRGVGRLLGILRFGLCPHLRKKETAKWRTDPVNAVFFSPGKSGAPVDRFKIVSGTVAEARQAVFTIAIGEV